MDNSSHSNVRYKARSSLRERRIMRVHNPLMRELVHSLLWASLIGILGLILISVTGCLQVPVGVNLRLLTEVNLVVQ